MAKQQLIKEIIKEFHKGVSQSSHSKVMAENQLIQNFPSASFGIQFVKMLNLTLGLVKIGRNKVT